MLSEMPLEGCLLLALLMCFALQLPEPSCLHVWTSTVLLHSNVCDMNLVCRAQRASKMHATESG